MQIFFSLQLVDNIGLLIPTLSVLGEDVTFGFVPVSSGTGAVSIRDSQAFVSDC